MVNAFQVQALSTRLGIPFIYGVDAVHGHGNLVGETPYAEGVGDVEGPEWPNGTPSQLEENVRSWPATGR